MAYNHIYNLQFKGLDQVETDLYYQVKFEKYDDTVIDYDIIELTPAQDSPFVLNYKATEDNIFWTSGSSLRSADPAMTLHIFFAGQPILISII